MYGSSRKLASKRPEPLVQVAGIERLQVPTHELYAKLRGLLQSGIDGTFTYVTGGTPNPEDASPGVPGIRVDPSPGIPRSCE